MLTEASWLDVLGEVQIEKRCACEEDRARANTFAHTLICKYITDATYHTFICKYIIYIHTRLREPVALMC